MPGFPYAFFTRLWQDPLAYARPAAGTGPPLHMALHKTIMVLSRRPPAVAMRVIARSGASTTIP
jgi:hypothetical protein